MNLKDPTGIGYFNVKPEEIPELRSCGIDNLKDIVQTFCWCYIDWQKFDYVEFLTVFLTAKVEHIMYVTSHIAPQTEDQYDEVRPLEIVINTGLYKLFQPIKVEHRLSLTVCVDRPTEMQRLLAVGSYLPVFKRICNECS